MVEEVTVSTYYLVKSNILPGCEIYSIDIRHIELASFIKIGNTYLQFNFGKYSTNFVV